MILTDDIYIILAKFTWNIQKSTLEWLFCSRRILNIPYDDTDKRKLNILFSRPPQLDL